MSKYWTFLTIWCGLIDCSQWSKEASALSWNILQLCSISQFLPNFAIFYNYLLLNWVAKRDPFKSLMLCCSELYRAAVADNLEEIKMLREKWQMTELSCSCDCEKIPCQLVCIGCQAVTAIPGSFPAHGWKQSSKPSREHSQSGRAELYRPRLGFHSELSLLSLTRPIILQTSHSNVWISTHPVCWLLSARVENNLQLK